MWDNITTALLAWVADPSLVVLSVMAVAIMALVWSWHRDPKSPFDLQYMILDTKTGKVNVYKVGYMVILAVGVWTQITMTLRNQFNVEYTLGLLTIFATGRVLGTGIATWKDVKSQAGASDGAAGKT